MVMDTKHGFIDLPVMLSCGRCLGCRLERGRQWAVRCVHEAQMHEVNSFVTLTYNDEHLPPLNSLHKKDFQDFIKRLRRALGKHRISYFHCGEYGERDQRPHYHALLFGVAFKDLQPVKRSGENTLYKSEFLEKTWGLGYCTVGNVTFESAAYTAGYILKKAQNPDLDYGDRVPEYATMSTRPAIGKTWLQRFGSEVYGADTDEVIAQGRPQKPPRYYDKELRRTNEVLADDVLARRLTRARARRQRMNRTPERLAVRGEVLAARLALKKRNVA